MTRVFIGGSRKISRLPKNLVTRLDRIVERRLPVVVGDANGADKAVQAYLHARSYDEVVVFCSGPNCRNNRGGWPTRLVGSGSRTSTFEHHAAKDRAMAEEATVGLMIWDGKSKGTLLNVFRLLECGKHVAVYLSGEGRFIDLKGSSAWPRFSLQYAKETREWVERQADRERGVAQPALV